MHEQQASTAWQPFAAVPRDGTSVDLWNGAGRILNVRYLRADEVDPRYGKGGCWEHLARDGFRKDNVDHATLVEECLTHFRLVSADKPA